MKLQQEYEINHSTVFICCTVCSQIWVFLLMMVMRMLSCCNCKSCSDEKEVRIDVSLNFEKWAFTMTYIPSTELE